MRSRIRKPFADSGLIQRITNHNSRKPFNPKSGQNDDLDLQPFNFAHWMSGLHPFSRKSISDRKNEFMPGCSGCTRKSEYGGFFSSAKRVLSASSAMPQAGLRTQNRRYYRLSDRRFDSKIASNPRPCERSAGSVMITLYVMLPFHWPWWVPLAVCQTMSACTKEP
jgi:hypothetical protein